MNQSLKQYLCLFCSQDQREWAKWLPLAQYTCNSWPSSTTEKTPLELILKYTPIVHQLRRQAEISEVQDRIKEITDLRNAAQEALCKAQEHIIKKTKF